MDTKAKQYLETTVNNMLKQLRDYVVEIEDAAARRQPGTTDSLLHILDHFQSQLEHADRLASRIKSLGYGPAKRKELLEKVSEAQSLMKRSRAAASELLPFSEKEEHPSGEDGRLTYRTIHCEDCDEPVSMIIFTEQEDSPEEITAFAGRLQNFLAEHDIPAWILGPAFTDPRVDPDAPSLAIQVWPERGPFLLVTPDQILPDIEGLALTHCRPVTIDPEVQKLSLVVRIDEFVRGILAAGGGEDEMFKSIYHHTYNFHKLVKLCGSNEELAAFADRYPGFAKYAVIMNDIASIR